MPNWLQRLTRGDGRTEARSGLETWTADGGAPGAGTAASREVMPPFASKLAIDSPGAPGRAGAEALYQKWAAKWQEF
jgi:hypothetical protein